MKLPAERLKATTSRLMERNKLWAARHVLEQRTRAPVVDAAGSPVLGPGGAPLMLAPWERRVWADRTIADVAALKFGELHEAEQRANKLANRAPTQLQVVVIPARIEDARSWEAKAADLEASSRKVIDVTPAPALPKAAK